MNKEILGHSLEYLKTLEDERTIFKNCVFSTNANILDRKFINANINICTNKADKPSFLDKLKYGFF